MENISVFNWSIKKALTHVPDPLKQAQIKIFFFVFAVNLGKISVGLPAHIEQEQISLIVNDSIAVFISVLVLKLLMYKPEWLEELIHFALATKVCFIWSGIFLYGTYYLDISLLQQVFMAIMFSFYGLGRKWGAVYSALTISAIMAVVLTGNNTSSGFNIIENGLLDLNYAIIVALNFLVIVVAHFYFHNAIYGTLEEKKELNTQLIKAGKAKSDFLSTMSHELRTPLNSVIGMAHLLEIDELDKDQKDNLEVLKFSAESLLMLINDILDFNKIDSGKIELESIPFNLADLLKKACAGFQFSAKEKNLDYRLFIDPEIIKQQVKGDPTRITQIIFNLTSNAIKFTSKGSVRISADVRIKTKKAIRVRFSIKDTGIGISPEKQDLIFEPFAQASKTITRQFGGTGLGLAIVKHLLLLHNSAIEVESKINIGTHFYFDIDFPLVDESIYEIDSTVSPSQKVELNELKLLLAEDNAMNILFMRKLLSNWNINTAIAENGQEVIDRLNEDDYDVILMDLHMPVMNGLEATKKIRKLKDLRKSRIHIIALTASVSAEAEALIKECGMNDYLIKPFHPDDLRSKLENVQVHINQGPSAFSR